MLKELEPMKDPVVTGTRLDLSVLAPALPVIAGTVTEILEHYLGEPLRSTRLEQQTSICTRPLPTLALAVGESVLRRRMLLSGSRSAAPVLYAESHIAIDRLDPQIRHGLLATDQPIGRPIRDNRLEVFRGRCQVVAHRRAWSIKRREFRKSGSQ